MIMTLCVFKMLIIFSIVSNLIYTTFYLIYTTSTTLSQITISKQNKFTLTKLLYQNFKELMHLNVNLNLNLNMNLNMIFEYDI